MDPQLYNACLGKSEAQGGLNRYDFIDFLTQTFPEDEELIMTLKTRDQLNQYCQSKMEIVSPEPEIQLPTKNKRLSGYNLFVTEECAQRWRQGPQEGNFINFCSLLWSQLGNAEKALYQDRAQKYRSELVISD